MTTLTVDESVDRAVESSPRPDNQALLGWFLHERDIACPRCGCNVRNLTHANCPECREELTLTIRTRGLRLGWFLLAIAPCAYCGIVAPILLADIVYELRTLDRIIAWPWFVATGVGFVSGACALSMIRRRERFLQRPVPSQKTRAISVWILHAMLFAGLLGMTWLFG